VEDDRRDTSDGLGDAAPDDRGGSLRQRVVSSVAGLRGRLDAARETVVPVDVGLSALARDNHIAGFVLAGAIAFRLFVYLLPVYLVVLVIAGAAFAVDPQSPETLASSTGLSSYVASTISDASSTSNRSLWFLVPVTLWALFTTGRSGHRVIAAAHARAWAVAPAATRPHVAAGGFLLVTLMIFAGVLVIRHLRVGVLVPFSFVLGAAYFGAVWVFVSRHLPRAEGAGFVALLPGALLMGAGTQGLYLFNVLYLNQRIESASEAYGVLGVGASLLLWLYLLGRLMVAAPVLNATLWERGTVANLSGWDKYLFRRHRDDRQDGDVGG
jgi:uncharacterized BrkB/YihY/UPF0761 family membrane protein